LSNSLTPCRAALPHGRAADTLAAKSEGLQFPEALLAEKRESVKLAFDSLNAGVQIQLEDIHRDISVLVDVAQAHRRRVIILLDHLCLDRHAAVIDPQFDVFVAGGCLRNGLQVSSVDAPPKRFFAVILKITKLGTE